MYEVICIEQTDTPNLCIIDVVIATLLGSSWYIRTVDVAGQWSIGSNLRPSDNARSVTCETTAFMCQASITGCVTGPCSVYQHPLDFSTNVKY